MTSIVTASVDNGILDTWDIPNPEPVNGAPRGEMVYRGQVEVAAKILTDQSLWTLTLNLPPNFIYRIEELHCSITYLVEQTLEPTDEDTGGWQAGMFVQVFETENVAGGQAPVLKDQFLLWNQHFAQGANEQVIDNLTTGVRFTNGTLALATDFRVPAGQAISSRLINSGGAANIFLRYVDVSDDATVAITIDWFARVQQFTVAQGRNYQIRMATPTTHA